MPTPSTISDLSTTPASNSPAGSEAPSTLDDVVRAHQAITRTVYDAQQTANATFATAANLTTHTGSTTAHGISSFGATLVDDADAATARATLGVDASGTTSTHAALTATHGVSGAIVGTTDAQALTNKTIVAASNTITTAASGDLSATELNAALAELQAAITALESTVGGLGTVNVQTGYVSSTSLTSGSSEDVKYIDVTVTAVSAVANCEIHFCGGASSSSALTTAENDGDGTHLTAKCTARLTSTTNLRIACDTLGSTMVAISGRWQVIDHGA